MFGFLRLVVFGFLALGIIYLSISLYSRSVRREAIATIIYVINAN